MRLHPRGRWQPSPHTVAASGRPRGRRPRPPRKPRRQRVADAHVTKRVSVIPGAVPQAPEPNLVTAPPAAAMKGLARAHARARAGCARAPCRAARGAGARVGPSALRGGDIVITCSACASGKRTSIRDYLISCNARRCITSRSSTASVIAGWQGRAGDLEGLQVQRLVVHTVRPRLLLAPRGEIRQTPYTVRSH